MFAFRLLSAVIIVAIVAVAAVPLLVLVDLVGGGDGWGLCPNGLGSCRTSYFHGPELFAALAIVLFGLVGMLRISFKLRRFVERRQANRRARVSVRPPRARAGRR